MEQPFDSPVSELGCTPDLVCPNSGPPGPVDKSTIFLTYCAFMGDAGKVGAALDLDCVYIGKLAESEKWPEKVQKLRELRQQQGAEALAKELNRTVNFVQAVRLRTLLDRAILHVTNNEDNFASLLRNIGPKGNKNASCKAVLELVKSVAEVHKMTYQALGDSLSERIAQDSDEAGASVSLSVMKALAAASGAGPLDPTGAARERLVRATSDVPAPTPPAEPLPLEAYT